MLLAPRALPEALTSRELLFSILKFLGPFLLKPRAVVKGLLSIYDLLSVTDRRWTEVWWSPSAIDSNLPWSCIQFSAVQCSAVQPRLSIHQSFTSPVSFLFSIFFKSLFIKLLLECTMVNLHIEDQQLW